MSAILESLYQEALKLPADSRLNLVERLIISSGPDQAVEQEQIEIAQSRLQQLRSGAVKGVPVEDAFERIRQSLKRPDDKIDA